MKSVLPPSWNERVRFDLTHVWHPFTQMKEHERSPPVPVIGGDGCDLVLADGTRVLDGISSWWTCIHGHGHPRLMDAIARQASTLDHVMFAGFTHEPALELVARLRPRLPQNLTRVFFSDNGSTAVEVALKMTFQAQFLRGERARDKIGALHGAYHGDTLGAVGVGELGNFLSVMFRPLLLRCERLALPDDPRCEVTAGHEEVALDEARAAIDAYFARHGASLAAFIAEPRLQGAGGMRMWPQELLTDLRRACDRHGVFLIFDEVLTGFGRTGSFLACVAAGVQPDVLCLSKGLTGGVLPLAVTCATEALFELFWSEPEEPRAFLHGHSYTANPIACAVAAANLALFDETPVMEHAGVLAGRLRTAWQRLAAHPTVRRARCLGTVAACDLVDRSTGKARTSPQRDGLMIHRAALERGLLVRPIGSCLYLLPPLSTPGTRIDDAVETLVSCLDLLA
jgi:adenosylmethionine-8-amino-7-oxononanoate aminotransferase